MASIGLAEFKSLQAIPQGITGQTQQPSGLAFVIICLLEGRDNQVTF